MLPIVHLAVLLTEPAAGECLNLVSSHLLLELDVELRNGGRT